MWSNIPRSCVSLTAIALAIGSYLAPDAMAASATPSALSFQAVQGGTSPASQSVTVSKISKKTTNWTASDNANWLSVSPASGSITNTAQIVVSVNTAGLAPGTYSATVAVTMYQGGSASIPVSVTVAPATATSTGTGTSTSTSTTASLSWNPSTSTGVAGYKVYVGTAPGVYGPAINAGNVTSYTIANLGVGYTYYFVVTDYDASGNESGPSNEVTKVIY